MNERFALAGKGLYYLFLSAVLSLVSVAVLIIPIVGWIAAPILVLVGVVLEFVGPYSARTAHPNFQNAFYIALGVLVASVIKGFLPDEGTLAGLAGIIIEALSFLLIYFICTAAGELLAEKGDTELAAHATLIWKLVAACAVVSILCTLTGWIPVLGAIVGVAGALSTIVAVVASILRILFYYKASNFLLDK